MNLPALMKRNMPHNGFNANVCLKFSGSVQNALGFGKRKNDANTLETLLLASMNNSYVENQSSLVGISGQTVRNYLKDKDPDLLLHINKDLIATMRDTGRLAKPLIMAMDWHDEMYYCSLDAEGIIGTKNSRGTNYAYEYCSVSVVMNDLRFVIAVIPVERRNILERVSSLLDTITAHGIRIRLLLFDGGFYSIDLIRYLVAEDTKFIMHSPKLKRQCGDKETDRIHTTGSHSRRKDQQATFRLVSVYGKKKNRWILYTFATNTNLQPKDILRMFKKRWGIETGYRMIRKFLAKTTSKRRNIRLLYFYLAVLLYNLWVLMNLTGRIRIIADVMKALVSASLIRTNPIVTALIPSNSRSGGDF